MSGGGTATSAAEEPALRGCRVIELAHAIAGPQCAQILADHGADVVKIEPREGETARSALPMADDESLYFASHNRGKRSLVLDLKSPEGLEILLALARRADILITNYTVGVPSRLGWSYRRLSEINPRLIYAHISGFGFDGEGRERRAIDGLIQSMSGVPDCTGDPDQQPTLVGTFIADHIAAYHAAIGILMAMVRRERTGEGAFVDVSMLGAYSVTAAHEVGAATARLPRSRTGNRVPTAFADTFKASDGYIFLCPYGQAKWDDFVRAIGANGELGHLDYFTAVTTERDYAESVVAEWCLARTRDEVLSTMTALKVPCGPVWSVAENVADALAAGDPRVVTVRAPGGGLVHVPGPVTRVGLDSDPSRRVVPQLGEHSDEVLAEVGCPPAHRPEKARW
jgi:CoA:oxalate CoA-transferase